MGVDIRLPNIQAATVDGKVAQLQSYMYQMVEQLNWALNTVNSAAVSGSAAVGAGGASGGGTQNSAQDTFESIKSLIIKSADIVQAYQEKIERHFNGKYFADSDFGTYIENTKSSIEENSKYIKDSFKLLEDINGRITETDAYIKRGYLADDADGKAIYGVEVGQTTDGKFKRFARFTSERLSFYDDSGNEVAYISNQRLYITDATFLGTIQFGSYKAETTEGLAFIWIGG